MNRDDELAKRMTELIWLHNEPEPCLDPNCAFCAIWDTSTTEEFMDNAIHSLPMQTEAIQ